MTKGIAAHEGQAEGMSRREFLRSGSASCAALAIAAPAGARPNPASTRRVRSVILLWMEGGPSPYETFAPRSSAQESDRLVGTIPSRVPGVHVSELMPRMAGWMDRLTLYRAIAHTEGSHEGASHLALTGQVRNPEEVHLTLGEVLSRRSASAPAHGSHAECAPHLALGDAPPACDCLISASSLESPRTERRHALLAHLPTPTLPIAPRGFSPSRPGDFTEACVAARKQVEAGAAFVQVTLSGWDAHADLPGAYRELVPQLDHGFATLLRDLDDRSMLEETLVVCMGEFGRSPRVNALGGRDHWPYAGCAVLAGGGSHGQSIGEVDGDGYPITGAISPAELLDDIYARAGA